MENYICINGKKAELTEEQLKALGIELPKKNPFERTDILKPYYMITDDGDIFQVHEMNDTNDRKLHAVANYCTDYEMMQQRLLHETLNRLLWRYSMEHDGDKIAFNHCWALRCSQGVFEACEIWGHIFGECAFYSKEVAINAIKEVVEPFMKAHTEFKW